MARPVPPHTAPILLYLTDHKAKRCSPMMQEHPRMSDNCRYENKTKHPKVLWKCKSQKPLTTIPQIRETCPSNALMTISAVAQINEIVRIKKIPTNKPFTGDKES